MRRWKIITHNEHIIRRIAKWWKNGGLARCIEMWRVFTAESKALKNALKFWLNLTLIKCLKEWVSSVQEIKKGRLAIKNWSNSRLKKYLGLMKSYARYKVEKREMFERAELHWILRRRGGGGRRGGIFGIQNRNRSGR